MDLKICSSQIEFYKSKNSFHNDCCCIHLLKSESNALLFFSSSSKGLFWDSSWKFKGHSSAVFGRYFTFIGGIFWSSLFWPKLRTDVFLLLPNPIYSQRECRSLMQSDTSSKSSSEHETPIGENTRKNIWFLPGELLVEMLKSGEKLNNFRIFYIFLWKWQIIPSPSSAVQFCQI